VGPESDPDVQLMLAVQHNDATAFRQLFDKHAAGVVGFAMQFVGSKARAEELAQDVFLRLYRHRGRYMPRARFTTWLYRMVTNACITELRRAEHRVGSYSMDEGRTADTQGPPELPDRTAISGEDAVLQQERLQSLKHVLNDLPAQQRAALLLARVEGMSYDEVGVSLGCSVAAVKSLIHRATVTLRDRLRAEGA
jgi:RNA polymerase sigma-70 factor (ECF subfamily)